MKKNKWAAYTDGTLSIAKAIKALEKSVLKWERIVAGKINDESWRNCECCKLGIREKAPGAMACSACPIALYVRKNHCEGTPYVKWTMHSVSVFRMDAKCCREYAVRQFPSPLDKDYAKAKLAASKELDFLRDVLKRLKKFREDNA